MSKDFSQKTFYPKFFPKEVEEKEEPIEVQICDCGMDLYKVEKIKCPLKDYLRITCSACGATDTFALLKKEDLARG